MSAPGHAATCGCCTGLVLATPVSLHNRPGLSAVAYRVGTHPQFKASLLARLATSDHPALRRLTTRRDDDFAIMLCDAWATVADVITFYQERIANESWLRTARERRSIGELARLIDYSLRPGVAAHTHLAFDIEASPEPAGTVRPMFTGVPVEAIIPAGTRVMSVPGPGERPQTFETSDELAARAAWNRFEARDTVPGQIDSQSAVLEGAGLGLRVGDRVVFVGPGRRASADSVDWAVRVIASVEPDRDLDVTTITWAIPIPGSPSEPIELWVLRQRAGLMGHNAPHPRNLADSTRTQYTGEFSTSISHVAGDWLFPAEGDDLFLDGEFPEVQPGDFVLLDHATTGPRLVDVTAARIISRSAYSLSQRTTRLTASPTAVAPLYHGTALRGTAARFLRERLHVAAAPATDPIEGSDVVLRTRADDLPAGRLLLVEGIDHDTGEAAGEPVHLLRVDDAGDVSKLVFTTSLVRRYQPESVVIHANVAEATHGESVSEVIGSGDGSTQFQSMKLRQQPLTHVPGGPSGAESTLEVRVNDLEWHTVPSLYAAGPDDRVFVARQQDDGTTMIHFGDGITGERLPTGSENVRTTYRKGIGLDGLLAARQLSQLITRPLGVKGTLNPLPAEGAENPESADDARVNCTLTILTLDRVVSLQDYEDYARAYAGIAKSLATWFWDGARRMVLLTVAGPEGAAIDLASVTRTGLIQALRDRGDPHVPVDVRTFVPSTFGARVAIAHDPDRVREDVWNAVSELLIEHFAFEQRRFTQPVTLDEFLGVVQSVDGVIAANVTRLDVTGGIDVRARIPAAAPALSGGTLIGAELLTLDPDDLELVELA
ncbi:MAG: hypothetical protein L0271_15945 [Gemmatimonadetes bacterium]|nr:hypothetical protein [Gemmatimonadota bacterium]